MRLAGFSVKSPTPLLSLAGWVAVFLATQHLPEKVGLRQSQPGVQEFEIAATKSAKVILDDGNGNAEYTNHNGSKSPRHP